MGEINWRDFKTFLTSGYITLNNLTIKFQTAKIYEHQFNFDLVPTEEPARFSFNDIMSQMLNSYKRIKSVMSISTSLLQPCAVSMPNGTESKQA